MKNNIKWMALASLVMFSCSTESDVVTAPSTDTTTATPGTANFTKYVALGDSFAAGYSDGALFKAAQETAYPNILAQQFAAAGGGVFKTPFAADNIGGLLYGGNIIKTPRLYFNGLAPVSVAGTPTTETTTVLTGGFNNMGVPGAKSFHLLAPGYGSVAGVLAGTANPFFARFASSATTTVLADAVAQAPTFFSLWIGGNDELGYALAGGDTAIDQLTPPAAFDGYYNALITGLTANNAKGVVANLPYVSTLPYFTTVPYNPVALDAAKATALNSGYASYNGGLQAMVGAGVITADEATKRTINFTASATNAVVIVDEYLTNLSGLGIPSYRHATSEDLLVLTSRTFIGTTVGGDPTKINGISVPLADKWVLSKNELAEIKAATDAFNITIKAAADAKGLAFVDAKAIMDKLVAKDGTGKYIGISANGFTLTASFVTGGAFSLDGVHPSPRGYALIANEFIKAINAKYGSTLKAVDLSKYRVLFPATL